MLLQFKQRYKVLYSRLSKLMRIVEFIKYFKFTNRCCHLLDKKGFKIYINLDNLVRYSYIIMDYSTHG